MGLATKGIGFGVVTVSLGNETGSTTVSFLDLSTRVGFVVMGGPSASMGVKESATDKAELPESGEGPVSTWVEAGGGLGDG